MRTTVTRRGQTAIPTNLRALYRMDEDTQIEWLDTGAGLKVIPFPPDPIAALRGNVRGEGLTKRLLAERCRDRDRE